MRSRSPPSRGIPTYFPPPSLLLLLHAGHACIDLCECGLPLAAGPSRLHAKHPQSQSTLRTKSDLHLPQCQHWDFLQDCFRDFFLSAGG